MNDAVYIPLLELAHRTGLPRAWLKAEANAGRLPVLRVGRRLLFDYDAVRTALAARASDKRHGTLGAAAQGPKPDLDRT